MQRNISPIQDLVFVAIVYFVHKKENHNSTFYYAKSRVVIYASRKLALAYRYECTLLRALFSPKKRVFTAALISMDRLLCLAASNIYPEGLGVKNDLMAYNTNKP
jgi:hypothetical protein